ncbi:hypothetical protein GCM10010469_47210 [Streptomyces labedae]|uniref:Uncharacterized protein n=1 Tax=Streptomyces labedae TaxID=285569 RepID=A0ABP6R1N9_9ACTN
MGAAAPTTGGQVTYGCVRAGSGAAKGTRVPLTAVGTLEPLPG